VAAPVAARAEADQVAVDQAEMVRVTTEAVD